MSQFYIRVFTVLPGWRLAGFLVSWLLAQSSLPLAPLMKAKTPSQSATVKTEVVLPNDTNHVGNLFG